METAGLTETSVAITVYSGTHCAQLFEAMRYKPDGHRFDFRWCH